MRFFCFQPDVVDDVQAVRYHTKSSSQSALPPSSYPPVATSASARHRPSSAKSATTAISTTNHAATITNNNNTSTNNVLYSGLNRSKSSLPMGKRLFGDKKHSIGVIGPPVLVGPPPTVPTVGIGPGQGYLFNTSTGALNPITNGAPELQPNHKATAGGVTDSEREGGTGKNVVAAMRRKSRRLSAPFSAAMGLSGGEGAGSGTDTSKKLRRVSKGIIGAPEGFRHEAHLGIGNTFVKTPDDRETWDVEAWRAEIERTLSHSTSSPPSERPKGPRPSSVNAGIPPNMPARHKARSSVDGAVSRRPIERDRDGTMSEDIHSGGGSGREGVLLPRNRSGSISRTSDGLAPRPSISTTASASGTLENQYGRRRSRSRSGSLSHGQPTLAQPPTANTTDNTTSNPMMNMAIPPPVSKYRNDTQAPGHTAGQPSITSVTSTALSSPTSQSSHANTTAFSPMTTTSSLNRSLSEKPLGYHPSHHHQHHHSQPTYGPSYSQGPNAWGGGYKVHHHAGSWSAGGQGGATGVSRSHSATAALPPSSTSSSMTAASFNNYPPNNGNGYPASSGSYAGSNSHLPNGRKPIPAQRRKPVPQHLPATAEVSPFPTLLVVNRESKVVPAAPFEYPAAVDGMDRSAAAPPTIVSISQVEAAVAKERHAVSNVDNNMVDPVSAAATNGDHPLGSKRSRSGSNRANRGMLRAAAPTPANWTDSDGNVKKELVPLLGVPGDDAHYVTKSAKARWDGSMAEIANALRDPNAVSPI